MGRGQERQLWIQLEPIDAEFPAPVQHQMSTSLHTNTESQIQEHTNTKEKTKRQEDKKTKIQKDKLKDKKDQKYKFNIVTSGQFRTLAMFIIESEIFYTHKLTAPLKLFKT